MMQTAKFFYADQRHFYAAIFACLQAPGDKYLQELQHGVANECNNSPRFPRHSMNKISSIDAA